MDTPIDTLAYLVALVESAESAVIDLKEAHFTLSFLFDIEEQVKNSSELLLRQKKSFPKGFSPQTPVMLTLGWSPISALLERKLQPVVLTREPGRMACATGIWPANLNISFKRYEECATQDDLFWYVLGKTFEKAKDQGRFVSIIACPGWDYDDNTERPCNFDLSEAQKADRVIWQRTPRPKFS